MEEYGAVELEITHHLRQYEADGKATELQTIETVELSNNPTEGPKPTPVAQRKRTL